MQPFRDMVGLLGHLTALPHPAPWAPHRTTPTSGMSGLLDTAGDVYLLLLSGLLALALALPLPLALDPDPDR